MNKNLDESISLSGSDQNDMINTEDYNISHFDDFDSKSMDIKNFNLTDRDTNPE